MVYIRVHPLYVQWALTNMQCRVSPITSVTQKSFTALEKPMGHLLLLTHFRPGPLANR